jgi:aryl-alcohol dehydrogenase-like predicted oxidoreductase
MMFGSWGNPDAAECHRIVDVALEGGVTLFDTADMYDFGVSEQILGSALRGRRDRVVLATKVGRPMSGDPHERGLSRRWIVHECEASLRRLGTDRIDLLQMHRPDPGTPIEETLSAFDDLVRAGKVRAIGTSTFSASQLRELHGCATSLGTCRPTSEQPPYSVLTRGIEAEVIPACRQLGVALIVWAPLNGGWLTGKYQAGAAEVDSRAVRQPEHFDHRDPDARAAKLAMVAELQQIATDAGISLLQLAIGFALRDPVVACALVGPRTLPQLEQLLAAGVVELSADTLAAIDRVVAPGVNVNPRDAE